MAKIEWIMGKYSSNICVMYWLITNEIIIII